MMNIKRRKMQVSALLEAGDQVLFRAAAFWS